MHVLRDASTLVHTIHNERLPIHRLPPEILARIFSDVRISVYSRSTLSLAQPQWTFPVYDDRELCSLLLVCRRWREVALNSPLLWSHVMARPGIGDNYLTRSASVPLTIYISPEISLSTTKLSGGNTFSVSCPAPLLYKSLKSIGKVHSRIRALHVGFKHAGVGPWMLGFLATLGAEQLEHCSIEFPLKQDSGSRILGLHEPDVAPRLTLFSGGHGNTGGNRLRSLHLSAVPFLPSNKFPSLTTFSLSNAIIKSNWPGDLRVRSWGLGDLIDFLSGSPHLEELSIRNAQLDRRASPASGYRRVVLSRLRHLVLEEPPHTPPSTMQRALSIITYPQHCHVLLATFGASRPEIVNELFALLPHSEPYSHLRIRIVSVHSTMLHFVPASRSGSLSVDLRISNQLLVTDFSPQRQLRALFDRSYPWCCSIEELWLELAESDYYDGPRCLLGRFPGLRRLVVCQPRYVSPGGSYASLQDALHLLRPSKSGSVACPTLDTLCINIPAYMKDVEIVKQIFLSRAQSHPVRRLVVGYSPMLELEVIAEVFSLETLVEEFVCEELPPVDRDIVPSDWLLSIPYAFEDGGLQADWPKWNKGPLTSS